MSRERRLTILCCVAIAALFAAFLANAAKHLKPDGLGDLYAFYHGATALRTGGDVYARGERNYIYPPLIAFLYSPLSCLSIVNAGRILLIVNTLATLVSLILLARTALERFAPVVAAPAGGGRDSTAAEANTSARRSAERAALVLTSTILFSLIILSDKVRSELRMWQTDVLLLLGMSIFIRLVDRRPILAGLALGFAFNIKFLPILFLPYLLLRRRFAAAGAFVAGIFLFAFLPATIAGWPRNLELLSTAYAGLFQLLGFPIDPAAASGVEPIEADFSISITSFLARCFVTPDGVNMARTAASVLAIALLAALTCLTAYVRARTNPFLWPRATLQQQPPYCQLFLAECAVLWGATLCFSPQLNPRHLSMLLFTITPACALVLLSITRLRADIAIDVADRATPPTIPPKVMEDEGVWRRPKGLTLLLLVCLIAYFLALVLPPAGFELFEPALTFWRRISGHAWVMLILLPIFLHAVAARVPSRTPPLHSDP